MNYEKQTKALKDLITQDLSIQSLKTIGEKELSFLHTAPFRFIPFWVWDLGTYDDPLTEEQYEWVQSLHQMQMQDIAEESKLMLERLSQLPTQRIWSTPVIYSNTTP